MITQKLERQKEAERSVHPKGSYKYGPPSQEERRDSTTTKIWGELEPLNGGKDGDSMKIGIYKWRVKWLNRWDKKECFRG